MKGSRFYRPAAFIKLYIRLEDFSSSIDPNADPDDQHFVELVVKAQKGHQDDLNALASYRAAGDAAGVVRASAAARKSGRQVDSLKSRQAGTAPQSRQPGDAYSIAMLTAPIDMAIELNGSYMCDKLIAKFPFKDAPLMSQLIRACIVEGYLGTIATEDFGYSDRWRLPLQRAQIMFRGYVDDWDTEHDEEDAVVHIAARSMESILIDGKINPWAKDYQIKGDGEPISVFVNRILGLFPPTSGKTGGDQFQAIYYPGAIAGGTPADARAIAKEPLISRALLKRTLQSAQSRNQAAGGQAGSQNPAAVDNSQPGQDPGLTPGTGNPGVPSQAPTQELTVWDFITRACRLAGVIPVYDPSILLPKDKGGPGDMLLLKPPHTAYAKVDGVKIEGGSDELNPDGTRGFSRRFGEQQPSGIGYAALESEVRLMVWGQNISKFKTNRKLGRIRAPAVEVISLNTDAEPADRVLVIRYPPGNSRRGTKLGHKGEWAIDHVQTFNIGAVRDLKQLAQIAVGLYHDLARQEITVRIETDDMASWFDPRLPIDPNEDPDLLRLRSGTPVRVMVARQNKASQDFGSVWLTPLSEVFEKREGNLKQWLLDQQQRFNPTLDDASTRAAADQIFQRMTTAYQTDRVTDLFYTRVVNHKFSAETGWSAEMELMNFVEARSLPKNLSKEAQATDAELRIPPQAIKQTPDQTAKEIAALIAEGDGLL